MVKHRLGGSTVGDGAVRWGRQVRSAVLAKAPCVSMEVLDGDLH